MSAQEFHWIGGTKMEDSDMVWRCSWKLFQVAEVHENGDWETAPGLIV